MISLIRYSAISSLLIAFSNLIKVEIGSAVVVKSHLNMGDLELIPDLAASYKVTRG